METTLGRFGDRRLEKGGPGLWTGRFLVLAARRLCLGLGATGPARCG